MAATLNTDVSIIIADARELRITTGNGGATQRRITEDANADPETFFNLAELLEIGSWLHESDELRTHMPSRVQFLGWTLYANREPPTRSALVEALLYVTAGWYSQCINTERCVPAQTLASRKDVLMNKLYNANRV